MWTTLPSPPPLSWGTATKIAATEARNNAIAPQRNRLLATKSFRPFILEIPPICADANRVGQDAPAAANLTLATFGQQESFGNSGAQDRHALAAPKGGGAGACGPDAGRSWP